MTNILQCCEEFAKKILHPFPLIESSLGCLTQRTVLVLVLAQAGIASLTALLPHLPEFRSQPGLPAGIIQLQPGKNWDIFLQLNNILIKLSSMTCRAVITIIRSR